MKKTIILLPLLLLVFGCSGEKETERSGERAVLRIGTDATYPPFESMNPATGQPVGFDIDLMKEICKLNGWKSHFIATAFDGIIPGLTSGKYDVVISAMTITPRRSAVVDFSNPYYLAGQSIAVPLDDTTISGVGDLMGRKVGVQLGTTGEMMAKKMEGLHVYSFDNIGAAFIDMANGNLDVVLNDFPTTKAYIKKLGTAKIVGEILSTEHYGIAVRKGERQLLENINKALREIKHSGRFREIHVKWFGTPQSEAMVIDSTVSK
jgi:ABC-type amino acid transport substrate-binding protein